MTKCTVTKETVIKNAVTKKEISEEDEENFHFLPLCGRKWCVFIAVDKIYSLNSNLSSKGFYGCKT